MVKPHLYDVDDLWEAGQITRHLVPLRRAHPDFRVTAFTIPAKMGDVGLLKKAFPWITFGIHGWEHTPFECASWTSDRAEEYIQRALDMGYDSIFKPPNWVYDEELVEAIRKTGVILVPHHDEHTEWEGIRIWKTRERNYTWAHTHIEENPATDFIDNHPLFDPRYVETVTKFLTPFEVVNG